MASINWFTGTGTYNGGSAGPLLVTGDYSKLPRPVAVRTDMESGPPKQRPYATATMWQHMVTYVFSQVDYVTFMETWWPTTAAFGTADFNWTDPTDSTSKDTRIINGQIDSCTPTGPSLKYFAVKMTFETYS